MPQMSPMDWLFLSMFFLLIYFMSFVMIYFLLNLSIKKETSLKMNNLMMNYYKLNW